MEKEKFKLSHTVLYAKGWYKKSDDVFEDLKEILRLDDYTPFSKKDVFTILITEFENSIMFDGRLGKFLTEIHPDNAWMYLKRNEEYDYITVIVKRILSKLSMSPKEMYERKIPKYTKTRRKPDHITTKEIIDMWQGCGTKKDFGSPK